MRLTWKLTAGLLLGVTVALLINLALRMEREADVFAADMRHDHALLASVLAADIIEEWRENGPSAARDVVGRRAASLRSPDKLQVHTIEPAALSTGERRTLDERSLVQEVVDVDGEAMLRTVAPVLDRGAVVLALEFLESQSAIDAYLQTTLRRFLTTLVVLLVVCAAFVAGFGFVTVGRPIQRLVEKARRTGRGDLGQPLVVRGTDELATLAGAINDMCDQLRLAHAERDAATEARLAAIDRLRHADRLSTLGTLSAGIAHELGTPLHIVAGRAQLTLDAPQAGDLDKKNARIIIEQTQRMTRIVRQLLDFARQRRPEKAVVDAAAVVTKVVELLSMLAHKQDIVLKAAPMAHNLEVLADVGQMEQALTNLVVNAIQASPAGAEVTVGGIRVNAVVPPAELGTSPRDEVHLTVTDKAGGIPPESVSQLFTPFFTTKDVGDGTGLGLAIAWGLMREHGGTIDVQTTRGEGSAFTLRFPTMPSGQEHHT